MNQIETAIVVPPRIDDLIAILDAKEAELKRLRQTRVVLLEQNKRLKQQLNRLGVEWE